MQKIWPAYKRDEIAEATYTVLTEQVKSQALAAGFRPDTLKFILMQAHHCHLITQSKTVLIITILGFVGGVLSL